MWRMYFGLQGSFCHFPLHFIFWWIIHIIIFEAVLLCLVSKKFLTHDIFWGRELWLQQTFFVGIANYLHKHLYMQHLSKDLLLQVNCYLLVHGAVAGNQSGAETGVCFNWSGSNTVLGAVRSQKQPIWLSLCELFAESYLSFLSPWLISVVFFLQEIALCARFVGARTQIENVRMKWDHLLAWNECCFTAYVDTLVKTEI